MNIDPTSLINLALVQIIIAMSLSFSVFYSAWILILKTKNLATIDWIWGLSFLVPFLVNFGFEGFNHGNIILFAMVFLWALRLSVFLFLRMKKMKVDHRYELLSKDWDERSLAPKAFFYVISPQYIVHIILCLGFYVYLYSPNPGWSAPFWNLPLAVLFLLGFFIEALADFQLYRFKNKKEENKNLTYTGGIWRFIKYPNYLGEILIWWSFGLLALPFQYGFLGLIPPIVITYLLIFKTGIVYLEKKRSERKAFPHPRPKSYLIPGIY